MINHMWHWVGPSHHMGAMARDRSIRSKKDGFESRESQSGYNAIFTPENCDIAPEKTWFISSFDLITGG